MGCVLTAATWLAGLLEACWLEARACHLNLVQR